MCDRGYKDPPDGYYGTMSFKCPWCGNFLHWNDYGDDLLSCEHSPMGSAHNENQITLVLCHYCHLPAAIHIECEAGATVFIPDRYPL